MAEISELDIELIDDPEVDIRQDIELSGIEELAASIENVGLIQPIVVFKNRDRFEIVVGHRRLLACRVAGIRRIPAIVREIDPDKIDIMKLDENIFREDVSAIQIGKYIYKLMKDKALTTMEIARYLGKTPQWVNSMVRLLDTDSYTQNAVDQGNLSYAGALALQKIEDGNYRRVLTEAAVKGGAHTRTIKGWVDDSRQEKRYMENEGEGQENYNEEPVRLEIKTKCKLCGKAYSGDELITIQIDPNCYPIFEQMAANVRAELATVEKEKKE